MANKRASLLLLRAARHALRCSRHTAIPGSTRHIYASESIFPHLPASSTHFYSSTTSGNVHKRSTRCTNLHQACHFLIDQQSDAEVNGFLLSVCVHSIGHEPTTSVVYTVHYVANHAPFRIEP